MARYRRTCALLCHSVAIEIIVRILFTGQQDPARNPEDAIKPKTFEILRDTPRLAQDSTGLHKDTRSLKLVARDPQ